MSNQNKEKEFVNGAIFEYPRQGAPEYVIGRLSFKRADMIKWLQSRDGVWVATDILKSKTTSKPYIVVNSYQKPAQRQIEASEDTQEVVENLPTVEYPEDEEAVPQDDNYYPF